MRVYLAGKIGPNDWRQGIVEGIDKAAPRENPAPGNNIYDGDGIEWEVTWPTRLPGDNDYVSYDDFARTHWPTLARAVLGLYDYVGPYYMTGQLWQQPGSHGLLASQGQVSAEVMGRKGHHPGEPLQGLVCRLCLEAIRRADVVFAWIDQPDCHGTIAELAYAKALNIPTIVAGAWRLPDLWFVYEMAGHVYITTSTPADALAYELARILPTFLAALARRDYAAYLRTDHWQQVRQTALQSAGGRCQTCNTTERLQVHHRTYDRVGREEAGDLTVLCNSCHSTFHGNRKLQRPVGTTL